MRQPSPAVLVCGVALLFGLTAWGGIALTSVSERIATIWFSNGLLVATLLTQVRNSFAWPALIGAGFAANLILNVLLGDSPVASLGIAAANSIEVYLAAYGLRGRLTRSLDLLQLPVLLRFFGVAVLLAPIVAAAVAALMLHIDRGASILGVMKAWLTADALGMGLVVPLILAVQPCELSELRGDSWQRCIAPMLLLLAMTLAVFSQSRYPLLFMVLPPVLWVVSRMGFNGAALAVSLIAAVAIAATLNGSGPFMIVAGVSLADRIFTMQLLLLGTLVFTAYPLCAILAAQRRLTEEADRHVAALSASQNLVRALNERMTLAAKAAKVGFWTWEPASGAIEWDAQMHQMFHIDPTSEVLTYDLARSRVHPMDIGRMEQSLANALQTGEELEIEFRLVWPDNTERDIHAHAMIQQNPGGTGKRLVGLNIDVTHLRRLDKMKSEFVAIVSHELRTPLTSIRGAAGLLAHLQDLPPKAQHLTGLINRNAERLSILVDDILDMEKIESGKLRFDLKQHPLGELLEQAINANLGYAARYQIRLRVVGEIPSVQLHVDATRFLQVMANLLSNAVKFSPPSGTVEISAVEGIGSVRIAVRDYGPGIPESFQSKIFGRFNQGDASDSRTKSGSGLGLAISKALVERMRGTISFITNEGRGTTFFVELPTATEAATLTDPKVVALPLELE